MLADFELKIPFDKSKSIMIGDRLSDVAVGNFCGLRQTYLIVADYSLEKIVSDCSWPDTFFFTPIRTIGEVVEFEIGI
jgi:histidinol phosphatase-like enzyme